MSWILLSWSSILAGVVTTLAVSVIMALLGMALGFSVVKPTSDQPTAGLGVAFGAWSIFSIIASLAAGGFVSGMFSGILGGEHGYMVWASVLLVGTLFGGLAVGTAVKSIGSLLRGIGSGAASVTSSVASSMGDGVSHLASGALDHLQKNISLNIDTDELKGQVASVLHDTGEETLQPEYLEQQMREARSDLRSALHELRLDTGKYNDIIANFLDKQKSRLDDITKGVDKDTAVTALANHRNIPKEEAQKEVDNALKVYDQMVDKAKSALLEVQQQVGDAKEHIRQFTDHARVKAEGYSSAVARSALAAAVALVLGAVICGYAGKLGTRYATNDTFFMEQTAGIEIPMRRVPSLR